MSAPTIERLDERSFARAAPELAELLVDAVEGGASVGFVRPFARAQAEAWWRTLADGMAAGLLVVLAARLDGRIVGTVQLRLAPLPNARHRAEVAKLLVHRSVRRRGIGRALMNAVEAAARHDLRTLLVLDTETGSDAEAFYVSLGWSRVGIIPGYAENPNGAARPTTIFFKEVT